MNSTNNCLSKGEFKLYKRLRRLIIINHQRLLTEGKGSENKKSRQQQQQQQHKRHQTNDVSNKIVKKKLQRQEHKRCNKTKKIQTRKNKKENE